jgi:D-alanyl-D-alanine carboxypeptidase
LLVGAALRDPEPAPGVDIEDCAQALLVPSANRAAIAAAVANCGIERVMI